MQIQDLALARFSLTPDIELKAEFGDMIRSVAEARIYIGDSGALRLFTSP